MQLKLPIYDNKKIVKTYTTNTIDFSFGVVEDVLDALDLENLNNKNDLARMVVKCSKQLKPFLMDLFDGLTPDEIRKTQMSDIITIFKNLYVYATAELVGAVGAEKN